MSGTSMNKESVSIFDIPFLVELICSSLRSSQIAVCRKVCKAWALAFAPSEWRTVWLYKHLMCSPYDDLTAEEITLLRDHSQWIQALGVSLFDTVLNDSLCTNLHSLKVFCDRVARTHSTVDDSSLALLWRNRRLRCLLFDFHDSYVLRHVLPNLPRLTTLQRLEIHLEKKCTSNLGLLLDVLQCLPPSLKELDLHAISCWDFSDVLMTPPHTWEPSALRRFSFHVKHKCYGPQFLIPFLRSCHQLERLALPAMPSDYTEELMRSLASCPRLEWLELNNQCPGMTEFGRERHYFSRLQQELKYLSIDIYTDSENVVVSTVLAYSAATLQTLQLKMAAWLYRLDVAMILRTCPELRVLQVETASDRTGPMHATLLEDLVEAPWVCTRLQKLDLAITDVGEAILVTDADGERKRLAHAVLRLHQQFQDLEDFLPYRAYVFWKQNFTHLPSDAVLRDRGWQMTEDELRQLALRPQRTLYPNILW